MATPVHPGLWTWKSGEYAAGFHARLKEIPAPKAAPHAWLCGWEDADADLAESACHRRVLETGGEDGHAAVWGLLFDAGGDARVNGVAFDAGRTEPWKEGWIDADIKLGTVGR